MQRWFLDELPKLLIHTNLNGNFLFFYFVYQSEQGRKAVVGQFILLMMLSVSADKTAA